MKFIPILFSTPMVQSILEDRKLMTRRVVKMPPARFINDGLSVGLSGSGEIWQGESGRHYTCPYGKKGDVLWVRESHYRFGSWKKNGTTKTGKQKWRFYPDSGFQNVRYTDNPPAVIEKNSHRSLGWYKRSSLFMTKDACRLFLENGNIKVERLHDISEEDAKAEGVEYVNGFYKNYERGDYFEETLRYKWNNENIWTGAAKASFRTLWHKINGEESWNANPFVWVISFKKIERPDNFLC